MGPSIAQRRRIARFVLPAASGYAKDASDKAADVRRD